MQGRNRPLVVISALLVVLVGGLLFSAVHVKKNSDALWHIISEKCLPDMAQYGLPAPCQQVNLTQGYVTLKDLNGPLQFLLMPVAKITGIESPTLLLPSTPNFFALAWQQRAIMSEKRGAPVADRVIALAINSEYGRSQNQLHIHMSCLKPRVRQQLDQYAASLTAQWQPFTLQKHRYLIRTLTPDQLAQESVFIRLAQEVPQAQDQMGKYGMALAALPDGKLALLALERNWLLLNRGSPEELQDHQCGILQGG